MMERGTLRASCDAPRADGARLPYGLFEDRLVHVSEVVKGKRCACTCPGCGAPLLARKGDKNAHHFAHDSDRVCKAAWESTLHKLAKEVLAEGAQVMLPAVVIEVGSVRRELASARPFIYSDIALEVFMGRITPDVVVRGSGRELLVEVAVTHFAEAAKLDELAARQLACIEIDLSKVSRLASRAEHATLILETAPRRWLFNKRIEAAAAKEILEARVREELEIVRLKKILDERIHRAEAEWHRQPKLQFSSDLQWVIDAELNYLVVPDERGDGCFDVDPMIWRAECLKYVLKQREEPVRLDDVLNHLAGQEMLKPGFSLHRELTTEVADKARARIPAFLSPGEAVRQYVLRLVEEGIVDVASDGRWFQNAGMATAAAKRRDASRARRGRIELITKIAEEAVKSGGEGELFDARAWLVTPPISGGPSPSEAAAEGKEHYAALLADLNALYSMARKEEAVPQDNLRGLPLGRVKQLRIEAREERARDRDSRQQTRIRKVMDDMRLRATKLMGQADSMAWFARVLPEFPLAETSFELDGDLERRQVSSLLDAEERRIAREQEEEAQRVWKQQRAVDQTARCRVELEAETRKRFSQDPARGNVWLKGGQHANGLNGKSPWQHCVDKATMEHCLRILVAATGLKR